MDINSPMVEYLIIGAHSSIWITLFISRYLNIPLDSILNADAGTLLLSLPIIYLLGMIIDVVSYFPLDFFRKRIRAKIYDPNICKDEYIAHLSPELYKFYEARVKRVRILGAAIINWPILGFSLIYAFNIDGGNLLWVTLLTTAVITFLSAFAWQSLYKRAYSFRKKACEALNLTKKKAN